MNKQRLTWAKLTVNLSNSLEKRLTLDVANGAAHFHNHNLSAALGTHLDDVLFDLVCDVRHDLDRAAQVVTFALLSQHTRIDSTSSHIARLTEIRIDEPLIMAADRGRSRPHRQSRQTSPC